MIDLVARMALYRIAHLTQSFIWNRVSDNCSGGGLFSDGDIARGFYETNNPSLRGAFCPRLGDKGASARLASCSRRLDGL